MAEAWALSPDVRLGQLLAHLGLAKPTSGSKLGYIEGDEVIAVWYRHRAELLARTQGTPEPAVRPSGAAISVFGSSMLL